MSSKNTQEINYLDTDEVLEIYQKIMQQYGRVHTTLLTDRVDEIILQHKNYKGDIFQKAAVFIKELIAAKPRPFVDGHKRACWISTVRFLEKNGYKFFDINSLKDVKFIEENIVSYLIKIQQKEITNIDEIAHWIRNLFVK